MGRLDNKIAIVTGAGSGIGRASAILFASEGAKILAVDYNSDTVNETVQMINDAGNVALAQQADVGQEEQVLGFVQRCQQDLGDPDICYANAGVVGHMENITEQTPEQWQQVLQVNLIGPFLAIKHLVPVMVKNGGGAIICTASVAGIRSGAGGTAYSASKAGVISLVQNTANELTGTGIRVNAICPGLIETGMTKFVFDSAKERGTEHKIGQINPTQRAGEPIEIANMALFLASDEASYVNGQAIAVDGGLSSSHPTAGRRRL